MGEDAGRHSGAEPSETTGTAHTVVGRWSKATSDRCAELFPASVEFFEATYLGTKGPGQGFLIWDAGIYHRLTPDRISIQTASDELVTYAYEVSADRLIVLDPNGCRLEYRRVAAVPSGGSTDIDTEELT